MIFNKTKINLYAAGILSVLVSSEAFAQYQLEEITVTARKRAESINDVPDSITAFSQSQIESAGIKGIDDFASLTPNLSFNEAFRPGVAKITVRGLITPQVGEAPVAFVVDGITAPSMDFINQDLFAVERIEVLRGPQGALYGKGAVGGAINIVTQQPTDELAGKIKATVANGGTTELNAFVTGPLAGDNLFFQLGGSYADRDGLVDNVTLNRGTDARETVSAQGMIQARLDNGLTIDFRAKYSDSDVGIGGYAVAPFDLGPDASFEDFPATANIYGTSTREILDLSTKVSWVNEETDSELIFVLGYNEIDEENFADSDFVNMPSNFVNLFAGAQEILVDVEAVTAELRYTSTFGDNIDWQVGAYYQNRESRDVVNLFDDFDGVSERVRSSFTIPEDEFNLINFDPFFLTEYLLSIVDEDSSDAWAVFGQFDYQVTERLSAAFALRYDEDTRESFDDRQLAATFAERTFSETQPKLQISYDVLDDTMVYFSASRAFRSGGFNEPSPLIIRSFDQEVSENLEVGFKSTLWGGRMSLSGAVFDIDIENAQFTRFNLDSFTLENLGIDDSTSQGLELEAVIQATEGLTLSFGYGYTDTEIEGFSADPTLSVVGNTMPGVHRYNTNIGAEYITQLSEGMDMSLRLDYIRKGPIFWDLDNALRTGTSNFVNLRAGIQMEQFDVTLFGKNLTDERVATEAFFTGTGVGRLPNQPRYYGLEVGYSF